MLVYTYKQFSILLQLLNYSRGKFLLTFEIKMVTCFLGIDQYDRDSIINDFKSGVNRLLIATSVAARGLDVKNLILVVNYSCPNHYEDYVHRCGRTGRAGRKVMHFANLFLYHFLINVINRFLLLYSLYILIIFK